MQNESPGLSRRQRSMLAYDTHPCTNINRTYSKSVTIVIWILSLARFKYVTQLNHYNHWFILITASRDPTLWLFRAHTHTRTTISPHWELPFCRRHIFYRLNILLRATLVKVFLQCVYLGLIRPPSIARRKHWLDSHTEMEWKQREAASERYQTTFWFCFVCHF